MKMLRTAFCICSAQKNILKNAFTHDLGMASDFRAIDTFIISK